MDFDFLLHPTSGILLGNISAPGPLSGLRLEIEFIPPNGWKYWLTWVEVRAIRFAMGNLQTAELLDPGLNPELEEGIQILGELKLEDLQVLDSVGPSHTIPPLKHIRQFHHAVARLVAIGKRDVEICSVLSIAPSTLSNLRRSPMFNELVELYMEKVTEKTIDMSEIMSLVGLEAMTELHERLIDPASRKTFSVESLRRLSTDYADRLGHSPVRRTEERHVHSLDPETVAFLHSRAAEDSLLSSPPPKPSLSRVSQLSAISEAQVVEPESKATNGHSLSAEDGEGVRECETQGMGA